MKEQHPSEQAPIDTIKSLVTTPAANENLTQLPQAKRNYCSLLAVMSMSIPGTLIGYIPQRLTSHAQVHSSNTVANVAKKLYKNSKFPISRYLWKGIGYSLISAPFFKLAFAGPMLIAKDLSEQPDCKHPKTTYFSGALCTVILQVIIDFDRRKNQLDTSKKSRPLFHYWRPKYLKKDLLPFLIYMFVANVSSLLLYDGTYNFLEKRYPDLSKWWIGAGASIASLPIVQAAIVPVDTWATRIMSRGKDKGLSGRLFFRVLFRRSWWKLLENGYILTSSYIVKDALIHKMSEKEMEQEMTEKVAREGVVRGSISKIQ